MSPFEIRSMYSAETFNGLMTESSIPLRLSTTVRSPPSNSSARARSARRPCWRAVATRTISSCSRCCVCVCCASCSGRSKTAAPVDWFRLGGTRRVSLRWVSLDCLAICLAPWDLPISLLPPRHCRRLTLDLLPSDRQKAAAGHPVRFTQLLVTSLRHRSPVPEVDPPDVAGAQLFQCRQKLRLISARRRRAQHGRIANEEHAVQLVVKAD